ncbi:MAG: glutathione S-transferase family protein [bacterium]
MFTVYGVYGSPYFRKVLVVLSEKDLSYEVENVIPLNVSAEFKKISPLGKIPAFRDGDKTLPDSSIISAYLEKKHPEKSLYPSDPYEYARALWFEEYGDTALMQVIGAKIFFPKIIGPLFMQKPLDEAGKAAIEKAVAEDLPPLFDYLEGELKEGAFLVGDRFTIGDVGIASPFVNLLIAGYGVDEKRWPKLSRYLKKIWERPSFKDVIEKEKKTFSR